ncbi:ATP-grasp domain-containing protein [Glycomyces xiaoerkulensis]|uniref:ATP-grasp domain-containing protein n=1 Tax=Glycomyces xiaoerkulensis TaxID=2038139 RepID=UPI000C259156|nr:ATP-grasp domain-containing protein [Glycomyces xiaoerkulensis]
MKPAVLFLNTRRTELEYAPAFEAARELGYDPVLICDADPGPAKLRYAAEVHVVDTYDADKTVDLARDIARHRTVAGVTTWSDRDVVTVALIAEALGLPGTPVEAARAVRNKALMRRRLAHRPELIPPFRVVRGREDLAEAVAAIGFPAVLKPTVGSGSKGIYLLHDETAAERAWEALDAYTTAGGDRVFESAPGELVYERMLQGTEHSVEGFVSDGRIVTAGITDKETTPDFRLEAAHVFPTALPEESAAVVHRFAEAVVAEYGLDNCAFHLECILEDDGEPRLVEVAGRIGGDYITSHLVPLATGRSYYADAVRVATGEPLTGADYTADHIATVRKAMADRAGTFRGIANWEETAADDRLVACCLEHADGDAVRLPPDDFMSCVVATLIARRPLGDREQAVHDVAAIAADLEVEIERP